jgi:hypothetical protein
MSSQRSGEFKRSVMSALAAVLAAAVPSLVSSPALADKRAEKTPAGGSADAPAKDAAKPAKKTHAAKKASAHQDAKPEGIAAARSSIKKPKKTASRAAGKGKKTARRAGSEAPKRRCVGAPISIDRMGLEGRTLTLLDCHDRPVESAREALSVIARPWGAQKPAHLDVHHEGLREGRFSGGRSGTGHGGPAPIAHGPDEVAPGVRLLDKGLLTRIGAVARRFPGKPISLVSGYRPQSRGSLHQAARALDLRVAGVTNEELVAFCKTLPDTGCGYYPNSSFVHFDVRNPGTGPVTWIDASGPGQAPHYVRAWPPPPEDADVAVLPPDTQPRDGSADPWTVDPADEHAADHEPSP